MLNFLYELLGCLIMLFSLELGFILYIFIKYPYWNYFFKLSVLRQRSCPTSPKLCLEPVVY